MTHENLVLSENSKADVSSAGPSSERKGLALDTSAFESPYGGQFTLSTQFMKPNFCDTQVWLRFYF